LIGKNKGFGATVQQWRWLDIDRTQ